MVLTSEPGRRELPGKCAKRDPSFLERSDGGAAQWWWWGFGIKKKVYKEASFSEVGKKKLLICPTATVRARICAEHEHVLIVSKCVSCDARRLKTNKKSRDWIGSPAQTSPTPAWFAAAPTWRACEGRTREAEEERGKRLLREGD